MIAYFDCIGGISGDMTLGALVDVGVSVEWLQKTLSDSVGLKGFEISSERVQRHGVSACRLKVSVSSGQKPRNLHDIQHIIENSDREYSENNNFESVRVVNYSSKRRN